MCISATFVNMLSCAFTQFVRSLYKRYYACKALYLKGLKRLSTEKGFTINNN
jgi:hypothetical protein